jgi:hypothetical protein
MEQIGAYVTEDGGVVPEPTTIKVVRETGFGTVPGLDEEELADPDELERQVMIQEWAPILALPAARGGRAFRPDVDEDGYLDWGAFGTVDFRRCSLPFDGARYKARKLEEELQHVLIMLGMVRERLKAPARAEVLQQLDAGTLGLESSGDADVRAYAKWYLRARRIREDIRELRQRKRRAPSGVQPRR